MARVDESDCIAVLRAKLGTYDFQIQSFELIPFVKIKGFQGSYNQLKIQAVVKGERKTLQFFVKSFNKDSVIFKTHLEPSGLVLKEYVFFTELIKDLQPHAFKKITAECYYAKLNEIIVMEDLQESGYDDARVKDWDMAHVAAILNALARLHASSIAFEEKTGVKLEQKYERVCFESFYNFNNELNAMSVGMHYIKSFINRYFLDLSEHLRSRICTDISNAFTEFTKPSAKYRNVVCHGDLWNNNFLFKYENPLEAILVDFQMQRFAPPAMDIMLFICIGPHYFRKDHENEIKELYYDNLVEILASKDLDAFKILPKEVFIESCDHYLEFGLAARLTYAFLPKMPEEFLRKITASEAAFEAATYGRDISTAVDAYEKHSEYRSDIDRTLRDLIDFYTSKYHDLEMLQQK